MTTPSDPTVCDLRHMFPTTMTIPIDVGLVDAIAWVEPPVAGDGNGPSEKRLVLTYRLKTDVDWVDVELHTTAPETPQETHDVLRSMQKSIVADIFSQMDSAGLARYGRAPSERLTAIVAQLPDRLATSHGLLVKRECSTSTDGELTIDYVHEDDPERVVYFSGTMNSCVTLEMVIDMIHRRSATLVALGARRDVG